MKKYLFILITVLSISCKKSASDDTPSQSENIPFKYEVICSKGTWSGQYITQDGGWSQISKAASNWSYSGITLKRLFIASIVAQPDPLAEGVTLTINIYFDGKRVKTQSLTTTNEHMVTSMSYVNR